MRQLWGRKMNAIFISSRTTLRLSKNKTIFRMENLRQSFSSYGKVVDLRSDTVTMPTESMLKAAVQAPLGDDVMGEDPTTNELEAYMADMFGKEKGLFVPTGTMANLVAILSHCHTRASEIIIGKESHISLWEGGNAANLGGVHTKQIAEDEDGRLSEDDIRYCFRTDEDDHCPQTTLLCLENTHNMMGGVALPPSYMDQMGKLTSQLNIKCHVDGARIFNSAVAQDISVKDICKNVDSVSICFSKGLGAPIGSVLVGDAEFIRLAKRARKRCGGGMRQVGVIASMGLYAVKNNVERLRDDHERAKKIGKELHENGFYLPRNGKIDSNIVYFALPEDSAVSISDFKKILFEDYGVKVGAGYSKGGKLFRAVTHLGIDDDDAERAMRALVAASRR